MTVTGSLAVFVNGNNFEPLTHRGIAHAFEEIAAFLNIPPATVHRAYVYRLDAAANVILPRPSTDYLRLLTAVPRTTRLEFGESTVVFKNRLREYMFYDKIAEAIAKRTEVPAEYVGRNVLRIELRLRKKLSCAFGGAVLAEDLLDAAFGEKLTALWLNCFAAVTLDKGEHIGNALTVPMLRDALALQGVKAEGGAACILRRITDARAAGLITSNQACGQKRWVKRLISGPELATNAGAAYELAQAVHDAAEESRRGIYE